MQNWRQISMEAKDILTVCLAKAIDQALTAQLGSNWFANFAKEDAKEKVSLRITKAGQRSVRDLDLQALLKFLRYRSGLTSRVLYHHGFFEHMDAFSAEDQRRQLNTLLDRLMNDFRNRIEAHSRAADIEKELSGQGLNRIYGYEEAYQDMYKLARLFPGVTDSKGVPYWRRMSALTGNKKKKWLPPLIGAAVVTAVLSVILLGSLVWKIAGSMPDVYRNNSAPVFQQDQIAVQPIKVWYDGDELVALCYVMNGTDQTVSNVKIYGMYLTNQGKELAAANFGVLEDVTIAPGKVIQWKFRFPKDTVFVQDAELTNPQIRIEYECTD